MAVGERRPLARGARTRARILDAAEAHFARDGYAATRLEDIAASQGIRRAALFYYFRDKRELYNAVLDHACGGLLERITAALAGSRPLPERIEVAVTAWVDFVAERPSVARIILREGAQVSPERREHLTQLTRPFLALIRELFEEGRRGGHFHVRPVDPLHFVSAVAGATVFFLTAIPALVPDLPFDPRSPEHLEAFRREVLTITRRLLGIRAPRLVKSGPAAPAREPRGTRHDPEKD